MQREALCAVRPSAAQLACSPAPAATLTTTTTTTLTTHTTTTTTHTHHTHHHHHTHTTPTTTSPTTPAGQVRHVLRQRPCAQAAAQHQAAGAQADGQQHVRLPGLHQQQVGAAAQHIVQARPGGQWTAPRPAAPSLALCLATPSRTQAWWAAPASRPAGPPSGAPVAAAAQVLRAPAGRADHQQGARDPAVHGGPGQRLDQRRGGLGPGWLAGWLAGWLGREHGLGQGASSLGAAPGLPPPAAPGTCPTSRPPPTCNTSTAARRSSTATQTLS
jgi:hypothetical protein